MLTENEYLMAWGLYLFSVVGLGAVWWRLTRIISVRWLQNCLRVLFFALLVTPTVVVEEGNRMAPAFMIWMLESTIVESDNVARVYAPMMATLLMGLLIALAEAFYRRSHPLK